MGNRIIGKNKSIMCQGQIDSDCNPSVLRIFFKTTKTDREFKGVHIFVGKIGDDLCPVTAVTAFFGNMGKLSRPNVSVQGQNTFNKTKIYFSH